MFYPISLNIWKDERYETMNQNYSHLLHGVIDVIKVV